MIIPVHLFGQVSNMSELLKLKSNYNFKIIEDNAQSFGTSYILNNKKINSGNFGDISTTSFFPTKILGCMGDGGAIFTKSNILYDKIKKISNHGQSMKYYFDYVGVNSRLDTIQAALLNIKLKGIKKLISKRQKVAKVYNNELCLIPNISIPFIDKYSSHVYHQYTLRVKKNKRDKLKNFLREFDIPTMVYYPLPVHFQKAYKSLRKNNLRISEKLCTEVLSLPIYPEMKENQIEYVIDKIKKFKY